MTYYENHADRVELCRMLDSIKSMYEGEKAEKEGWVAFKKYHLGKMFI